MAYDTLQKKKVFVGVNTLTMVDTEVYGSHSNFWYYNGKTFPNFSFLKFHPRRNSIDRMRNISAVMALQHECDYLMFIDDDVMVEKDVLLKLLEAEKDVVMAETYIRGYPFDPMLFKFVHGENGNSALMTYLDFKENADDSGLVKCDAIGFSCALIDCNLLKKIPPPYFVTGSHHTEDIFFCMKAQKYVPGVSIFTTTKSKTQHLLDKLYIDDKTRKPLTDFCEDLGFKKDKPNMDNSEEYIRQCLNQFQAPPELVMAEEVLPQEVLDKVYGPKA